MKTLRNFSILALLFTVACQSPDSDIRSAEDYDRFGAEMVLTSIVPAAELSQPIEGQMDQWVRIEGTIREVCTHKGCWLTLDAGTDRIVRVKVEKDDEGEYLFTVPDDIIGRTAVVEGWLTVAEVDADRQRHLAEDGGATEEELAAMEFAPIQELQLTASSIYIQKPAETPEGADAD
jgi:hypothetical protein